MSNSLPAPAGRNLIALEWLQFGLGRLVAAAEKEGLTVHLLTENRREYAHELARLDSPHLVVHDVDTHDVRQVVAVAREIGDLTGLLSTTDTWSLVALAAREQLGLPGQPPEGVRLVRDKARLRRRLYEYGLSRSAGSTVTNADDASTLACRVGLPLIVKDSSGTSSEHVWLARTMDELVGVLAEMRTRTLRGTPTAEPYFLGPLYSVETITWEGQTRVIGLNSRIMSAPPAFREEALSFPVRLPDGPADELAQWIERVLKAVEYEEGFAHTEFILGDDGFEVVEINPRLGGALVGEAISRAMDINLYESFVDLALRRRPALLDTSPTPRRGVSHVLLYPPHPGVYLGCEGLEALRGHPGEPALHSSLPPGTDVRTVTNQDGCVAMVLATGATSETALQNALSAAGEVRIRMAGDGDV
ncbi:ATP-grasp domain-containing protein (plasmid) [Streptomyces sp. NBC_01591]|uniref:ATP-grasp domain-containing protein n=1 Tax=Streptomyces sp. NBC_01591 TaxID=2975888 RepID=UPI002DD8DF85|nr:ATP-grasp domain-containing protein [Streptomyces sp. NBC_01591]WSD73893.1 ATP-grasp domain-containing protein [Streptomyces sp. NBC_01591]